MADQKSVQQALVESTTNLLTIQQTAKDLAAKLAAEKQAKAAAAQTGGNQT